MKHGQTNIKCVF